jgi:hypothetical protein
VEWGNVAVTYVVPGDTDCADGTVLCCAAGSVTQPL